MIILMTVNTIVLIALVLVLRALCNLIKDEAKK